MPYTASSTAVTTMQQRRRVSLSKPASPHNDQDPNMQVQPEPMPKIVRMRLQLATTKQSLRPVLKQRAQSAPTSPGYPKYVRFDKNLEHVRLFLKAQTPSSAKEDPILDLEDEQDVNTITLSYPNWPTKIQSPNDAVSIESIVLSKDQKSLVGKCRVSNIAFNKKVTVRYTFNYWQDVQESPAAFRESIGRDNVTDRFMFNIPLADRMEKSSHETMYFCVKYSVNAGEFWDNNDGLNYQVEVHRGTPPKETTSAIDADFPEVKLDSSKQLSLSSSPTYDYPIKPSHKKQLGSRYDFGASLSAATSGSKQQRQTRTYSSPTLHRPSPPNRIQSFPSYFSSSIGEPTSQTASTVPISYPGYSALSQEGFVNKSPVSQTVSSPISIHARPAANSPSYFDLVNKYCFYGSDSPISRSPSSTPAIHC